MDADDWAVGRRIAAYRGRRGLTQEELAGLVGISVSMMKKIESGDRLVTRFSQLVRFAEALRINDLRDLTGVPLPLAPSGRHEHPAADAVSQALLRCAPSTSEPSDMARLEAGVEAAWRTWQEPSTFRYDAVGQRLPGLIGQVESILRQAPEAQRRPALRMASLLYQLVRSWTKRVGEYELSLLAADRSVSCARDADDPDLAGAAAWNVAMILSAQGRTSQARAVVARAIEELLPRLDQPSPQRLAVFGGLHLLGAAEAARGNDAAGVLRNLDVAATVAARTGETNHFKMVFGPTNVALYRVSTAMELGHTGKALRPAERVAVQQAPVVERRITFRLEAARCHLRTGNATAAVHMLRHIHDESAEEFRYSCVLRDTLRQLASRPAPALEADLRPLLAAAGIPR